MISWQSQSPQTDRAWPIWLIFGLYALFGMTDLISLFALPQMIGRSDVLAWWVPAGFWFPAGLISMLVAGIAISIIYDRLEQARWRRGLTIVFALVAFACLFLAAGSRVEVRAHDLRRTYDQWGRGDVVYRIEHASRMVVSCETGRKRRIYPSIQVLFSDGTWMDVTQLVTPRTNKSGSHDGLQLLERIDASLAARGKRYVSPYERIRDNCVWRTSQWLGPDDAARVSHLFRSP